MTSPHVLEQHMTVQSGDGPGRTCPQAPSIQPPASHMKCMKLTKSHLPGCELSSRHATQAWQPPQQRNHISSHGPLLFH